MDENWKPRLMMLNEAEKEIEKFKKMLTSEEPVSAFLFLCSVGSARAILETIEDLATDEVKKSNVELSRRPAVNKEKEL